MTLERIFRAALNDMHAGRVEPHCGAPARKDEYSSLSEVEWAPGYAEPGYDEPKHGVVLANWNGYPSRLTDILEKAGYAIEWSDEWTSCENCGKVFRTSPDSYGWQMSGVIEDGGAVCRECLDPAEHLESLENNPRRCNTIDSIDPADHGYVRYNGTYESGLHPGQTDDPRAVYDQMRAEGHTHVLFNQDDQGQFDTHWSAWFRTDEDEDI